MPSEVSPTSPRRSGMLFGRYETIEAIPDDASSWDVKVTGAPRLAATLAAHRSEALLYKRLATLVSDVPLAESLGDLEYRGAPRGSYRELCERLQITPRWQRFRD